MDSLSTNVPSALPLRPQDKGKPTLVLDLDGTLVSACDWRLCRSSIDLYDFVVLVKHSETYTERLAVRLRPGLYAFLKQMAESYEIIIFSYSLKVYVDTIVDAIDSEHLVAHRLSHDSCSDGVKDLNSAKFGRDLKRVVWLDDSPLAFKNNPDNGLVVPHFNVEQRGIESSKDRLLADLAPFLKAIAGLEDVREGLALWKAKRCKVVDGVVLVQNTTCKGWHALGENEPSNSGQQRGWCVIQ